MQTKEQRALTDLINAFNELCPSQYDKDQLRALINAFNELCPSQYDKDQLRALIVELKKVGESDKTVYKQLCGAILDGLVYGNWPSIVNSMKSN